MKKNLLFSFILLAMSLRLFAATGGPDAYGYIWKDSNEPGGPVYNWIDIVNRPGTVLVSGLSDDNVVGPFPIGFTMPYYWYTVNQFWIGSNGYVAFNNAQISAPFPSIPSSSLPQNFVAPMACDLNFDGATNPGKVYYWLNTAADTLVVSYENAPFWAPTAGTGYLTGSNTFQVIFTTTDSSITFQYKLQNGTYVNNAQFMSIGIENISGAVGLQHSYDQYPAINYAVKYYYPANSTFQVSDAAVMYNDNEETGARFLIANGSSFPMTTLIKNTGNQNLGFFNVQSRVVNSSNTTIVTSTLAAAVPNPGDEQLITHPNPFVPTMPGTYRFITETQLAGDATPSNNIKVMELVVIDTLVGPINLQYSDNSNEGIGLSWSGGVGGAGIYIEPPFSPFLIQNLQYYIVDNPQNSGFFARVYADDGPNGTAGTLLIDTLINGSSISTNAWNVVQLPVPFTVSSGGVYISWMMNGEGIGLGQDNTAPYSNQTFEILGPAWATYRYRETEDLMIRMVVSTPTGTVTNLIDKKGTEANLYPVPFNDNLTIELGNENASQIRMMDISGKVIFEALTQNQNRLSISTANLSPGLYLVQIIQDGSIINRKVIKE
jgi:hypothetical protein